MIEKTGRVFKCIGKKQEKAMFWNIHVEEGDIYPEVKEEGLSVPEGTLYILINSSDTLLVDSSQFQETVPKRWWEHKTQ